MTFADQAAMTGQNEYVIDKRPSRPMRRLAVASQVNRQAIADLLAGRSRPDVATVARLGHAAGKSLWPGPNGDGSI